mgnify:CR=1 FL=1
MFFILLQVLVMTSTVLMLLDTDDRFDGTMPSIIGLGLVGWAIRLFPEPLTVLFVAGLVILGVGFALNMGTVRRNIALGTGSVLIAVFSFVQTDWVFVLLNVFFALFSYGYALSDMRRKRRKS